MQARSRNNRLDVTVHRCPGADGKAREKLLSRRPLHLLRNDSCRVEGGRRHVSEALYDKVFAVNLKGPFRLSALFGTRMVAGAGGSIIKVSSVGSIRPSHAVMVGRDTTWAPVARAAKATVRQCRVCEEPDRLRAAPATAEDADADAA
jgi:NAD(P)-dependent dehydrogenase (short-subunit alcohol dehydrogenase family)